MYIRKIERDLYMAYSKNRSIRIFHLCNIYVIIFAVNITIEKRLRDSIYIYIDIYISIGLQKHRPYSHTYLVVYIRLNTEIKDHRPGYNI